MFSTYSRAAVAVALACVLAISAFGAVGAAAAQDGETGAATNESQDYQIQIDPEVRIVSSDWDGSTVTMIVESDITRKVTITDGSVQEVNGARDLRQKTVTVPSEGQTEITFTIENSDVRKVTASTPYGIVLVGETDGGGYDPGPVPFSGAVIGVALASVGTGAGTFLIVRKRRETDEKTVERVA